MGGASEPHIDSRLSEIFPSERHWSIFDFGTQDSNGQAIKGMWGIGAYIDEGAKTASLVLSICAGKWLNLAVCDVNSLPRLVPWSPTPIEISEPYIDEGLERERRVSTDRVRIEQSSDGKRRAVSDRLRGRVRGRKRPGESDRIAAFAIDLSGRLEGHQYRMIAVDHKGKEHRPYKLTTYGDGDGLTGHTFSFEQLSVEDIRKFRLLSRPYQNVTFKNVSLKPNFRTVVEVEVEEKAGEERLRRVKSEDRLHLLALCLHEYARKHNALLPQNKDGLEECFENKADFRWMVENVEYVAKGASVNQRKGGNIVVAYDKTLLDKGKGTNVLFLDYSVRFVLTNELAKLGILDMPLEAEIESPKRVGAGEEAVRWTGQGQMSLRLLIPKERVEGLGLVMFDRNRKKFVEAFAKSGPAMPGLDDKSCQWYEADFELPDIAMVETHGGKKYVLAGRRGVTVGRDSRDGAGLVDATAVQGEGGNWAVEYELCSTAHGSLRGAAKQYAGHNMGVLVDGKMISTFVLEDDPGPRAIITGNLTEEQAVALAEQLKLGSPAVRELLIKGIDAGDLGKVKKLLALNRNLLEASCFCTDSRGPLLEATLVSNIEIMRYLLEQGADVNAKVEQAEGQFAGATALHMAAEYGTPDMVELLVSYGANVNAIDGQGFTPLAMAASRAKPGPPVEPDNAIIEHLISSGADVNARGESGLSALTMAVMMQGYWKGQPQDERAEPRLKSLQQTIELLLASGAQKDIFSAAGLGDTERVAAILEQDPSTVSARRAFGMEPLQMAAMGGHRETVRLLVERGGNVFTRDVSDSPFRYAALVGDLEMFKLLEQLRDKYKDRMRAGRREIYYYRTAMNSAIQQGHGEIVAHLVDQERDIKAELMEYGLLEAAGEGQVEVVRILLERGAQVYASATLYKAAESVYDRADPDATMERYIAIAKLLIESGADVNWKYTTGSTPLLRAASNLRSYEHKSVNTAFFKLLMENGADVNARGKDRKAGVALICAVRADNLELAKLLLEAGADPLAHGERASDVYNCMEVARGEENKEMIALLAKYAEPGYAAMKKIFGGTIKEFVEVVTKKNDEALMGVTSDSREYGRQQWPKHAEKIRTDYEGHYELLEKIVGVGTSRGFAALFLPRPEGGEQRYSKLLLMQFPDGGWRVLQFYPTDDSPDDAFKEARNAYESYDSYQRAVFDAAGRLEDVAAEIPTGMTTEMPDQGRLTVRVKDGNLRFDFLDQPEGRYKAVEVHKDKVKCWRSKDLLGVAGKLKLEKGDLRLEAKDGKATLSAPGKQYVIDAHEGKVRVQYEGKVLMADKFTFELPALELNSRS
jgi:ankyrin repeat protein